MPLPQRSAAPLPRPADHDPRRLARPLPYGARPPQSGAHPPAGVPLWDRRSMAASPAAARPTAARGISQRPAPRASLAFLTVIEVAAMMRVSKMTVYRLLHGGELAAVRVGRSCRVPEQGVRDYLSDARTDVA